MTPTQLSNQELLPCPFCNGEPMIKYWEEKFPDCVVQISCQNCNTKQWVAGNRPFYGKEWCLEKAYKQWNTRTLSGQGKDGFYKAITHHSPLGETGDYDSWHSLVTPDFELQCGDTDVTLEQIQELADRLNTTQPAPVSVDEIVHEIMRSDFRMEKCQHCNGEGWIEKGTLQSYPCPACGGSRISQNESPLRTALQTLFNPK